MSGTTPLREEDLDVQLDPDFDTASEAPRPPRRSTLDVASRTEAARNSLSVFANMVSLLTPGLARGTNLGRVLNQEAIPPAPPLMPGGGSEPNRGSSVPSSAVSAVSEADSDIGNTDNHVRKVRVGDEWIVIRAEPRTETVAATTYPKTARATWTNSDLMKVKEKAIGNVLAKGDKLAVPVFKSQKDDTILVQVVKLRVQLKALKEHLVTFDMLDVFRIVMPLDVLNSPEMAAGAIPYDLFQHYAKLNIELVALSNHWYCRWADQPYFNENLSWSLQMLKANTEPSLWSKCHEEYEAVIARYHPNCQGGPLMLIIILKRIINLSAAVMDLLKLKVSTLKISSLPGEDVDVAVALITACYEVMDSASTHDRDLVPHDFAKTIYFILQTTSVDEFNQIFRDLYNAIQGQEDKGLQVTYPPVPEILTHASRAYIRIRLGGGWCEPVSPQAHIGQDTNDQSGLTGDTPVNADYVCWNCGKNHRLRDCPLPRDEAKIEAEVLAFRKRRAERRKNAPDGDKPKNKLSDDGKPLVLNKKGYYVADQKTIKAQAKAAAQEKAVHDIAALIAGMTPGTAAVIPPVISPPEPDPVISPAASHIEMIRNQISGMNLF